MKKAVVLGAGGFIGNHLVKRLKEDGWHVTGADLHKPKYTDSMADKFLTGDLRHFDFMNSVILDEADHVYQLAADMGGAGYIFTGNNDADIMSNSVQINLNVAKISVSKKVKTLFFASSACIYPGMNQLDPEKPDCSEASAYPACPDSEYGWEKLFSERLFQAYRKNYGLNVKIARFHNVFGADCSWNDGREKSPAALCRKVAEAGDNDVVEIWGDGHQTRSFLYIDDCIDATLKLMASDFSGPVNIGSEEMISIKGLAEMILSKAGKNNSLRLR